MKPTSFLWKPLSKLPTANAVKLAYDLHLPTRTVNPNLNIRSHEPIIFLHGVFGSKSNYRHQCQTIANVTHTPVYALDLRNHGDSEHALPVDYNTYSNDVLKFMQDHNLKKANIVGFSLGAKISLLSLLKYPELFRSGIILDNAPVKNPKAGLFLQAFLKSVVNLLNKAKIPSHDKNWRELGHQAIQKYVKDPVGVQYLLKNLRNTDPAENITDYEEGYCHFNVPVRLFESDFIEQITTWPEEIAQGKQYLGPVKVIKAKKSNFIVEDGLKAYSEHFPNYEISEVNCGHLVFDNRSQECVRLICDFIKTQRYKSLQSHLRNTAGLSAAEIQVKHDQMDLNIKTFNKEVAAGDHVVSA
ncbi:hypothetical protein WICPIJ_004145 [Wickerhamomyces pijperi]|uniref:AB hydrolase-1 domain-containing protein n=1 Tax=Wickerhamomyces pijperi TaxID=599730 RepID=A0A9P8Q678_WICPI|nr:hypothetical protein WICPIJ_004145 [Wickerhamomyces pijperi]